MKNLVLMLVFGILMMSMFFLVSAVAQQGQQIQAGNLEDYSNESMDTGGQQNRERAELGNATTGVIKEKRQELKERLRERKEENIIIKEKIIALKLMENNQIRLKAGNISADTDLNLSSEKNELNESTIKVRLRGGDEREIKIMPDTASERALERLRLRVCSEENNCSIELKEVALNRQENQARAAYEVRAEKQSKLLGLFKKKMQVQAHIDAENGEVIQTKKPWWAFLASEEEE